MPQPKRKQIRLPDYDYSSPGAYFVTICTENRRCILSDIVVGADALGGPTVRLTKVGKIVEKYILSTGRIRGLRVDKYCIMPNHVHLILVVEPENGPPGASAPTGGREDGPPGASAPTGGREDGPPGASAPTGGRENGPPGASAPVYAAIPNAVGALKRLTDREAGQVVFQRSYHDHIIRGEADYLEIWTYIDQNPAKWAEDRYFEA